MGRIRQLSKDIVYIYYESKNIKVTQWKMLKIAKNNYRKNIELLSGVSIYLINNITLDELNEINHKNITSNFKYTYLRNVLICMKCRGKGILDWVSNILSNNDKTSIEGYDRAMTYIRNKKGKITVITDNDDIIYLSTPKLKKREIFCDKCFGTGMQLNITEYDSEEVFFKDC